MIKQTKWHKVAMNVMITVVEDRCIARCNLSLLAQCSAFQHQGHSLGQTLNEMNAAEEPFGS